MRFEFIAELEDGEHIKVNTDGRDIRRWEAEYKRTMVGEAVSYTYMTQLAYIGMRRQRLLDGRYPTFALFDEVCVDIKVRRLSGEDEALVTDPTPSEATDDSSPS